MRTAVERASSAARSSQPVIVVGPPGSGRQHLARAIHGWSARSNRPLVTAHVSGAAETQQARELFGPDGAVGRANEGTLLVTQLDRCASSVR